MSSIGVALVMKCVASNSQTSGGSRHLKREVPPSASDHVHDSMLAGMP